MKIAVISNFYAPHGRGGAEKSTQLTTEALSQAGWIPFVVSLGSRPSFDTVNGIPVFRVTVPNVTNNLISRTRFPLLRALWHAIDSYNPGTRDIDSILERERPALILTNNLQGISVSVWAAAALRRIPVVHTIRDHYLLCPRTTMFRGHNCSKQCSSCVALSLAKKRATRHVSAVVGTSQYILQRHLDAGYFADLPNRYRRVIPSPLAKQSIARTVIDRRSDSRFTFVYAGLLHESKGIEHLLREFPDRSDARLLIFGDGESSYVSRLKSSAGTGIEFRGYRPIHEVLAEADTVIVPSLVNEAFGRIAAEALAGGIPVIASARGALPELVSDEQTGLLYEPNNPGELRSQIDRLMRHDRVLSCASIDGPLQAQRYDPVVVAQAYDHLLRDVLQRGSHGCPELNSLPSVGP